MVTAIGETTATDARVCVLLTVHNRKAKTLAALASLEAAARVCRAVSLNAIVVDAGSTDGTVEALAEAFPWVTTIEVSDDTYWASGMHIAETHARANQPEFLLWLNDDCVLYQDALANLLMLNRKVPGAIIVGAMQDAVTKKITYTGMDLRDSRRPTSLTKVLPLEEAERPVDTFNGNLVLVPKVLYATISPVDRRFGHSYGDIDYGLRAKRAGALSLLAPGTQGSCPANLYEGGWRDNTQGRAYRLRKLFDVKGVPLSPHFRFCCRHAGVLRGSVYSLATYARAIYVILRSTTP